MRGISWGGRRGDSEGLGNREWPTALVNSVDCCPNFALKIFVYMLKPLLAGGNLGVTNKRPMAVLRDCNYIFHARYGAHSRPKFCGQEQFPQVFGLPAPKNLKLQV